ncbi:MAG: hypothetical protein Q8933_03485 [Bacteroidota bacterium]|nr:hypothetical protein [Bacteroidota bacterium]MDP4190383.1 hypothetical protein [Bacteroidota bacterium]MDP4195322.1 hypothetical protein [Bacteroidota bacterium]
MKKVFLNISLLLLAICLGFCHSLSFMELNKPERVLSQGVWHSYITRHFNFYYRPGYRSSVYIDSIAAKQEENYSEVLKLFNLYDYGYKVKYFIFEDFKDYDNITGAGSFSNTYEIGNYGAVYAIDNDSLSNVTGKHEITHFLVDNFFGFGAPGPFKWLTGEGMAVWSDGGWYGEDLFDFAARKLRNDEISSPYFIVTHPEARRIQQNIYPMAGAFTKFMIRNYGLAKFLNLYQKGYTLDSFKAIFGKTFYEQNTIFENFLKRKFDEKSNPLPSSQLRRKR